MNRASTVNKSITYLLYLAIVLSILILKLKFHELWKDEWQAWFVARDKSLSEILSFLYYEGHPALWYLYLKIFTLIEGRLSAVSLLSISHFLLFAGVTFTWFFRNKLPIWIIAGLSLSYFFYFEYGIINRGYILVMLFYFLTIQELSRKSISSTKLGVFIFLLCQTELYGTIMAICILFYHWMDEKKDSKILFSKAFVGLYSGIFIFILSVFPRTAGHIAKTQGVERGFFDTILTAIQGNLSNTYTIGITSDTSTFGWTAIGLIASLYCIVALGFIFYNRKPALFSLLLFTIGMIVFSSYFFMGGIRQWGMGLIFFMGLLQLNADYVQNKIKYLMIASFIMFTIYYTYKAVSAEIKIPFTNAKEAGEFIQTKVPEKVPVLAINKFEATPVIGYANRNFYELPSGEQFSFFKWVDKIYIPTEAEIQLFIKFKGVGGIVILSPTELDSERFPNLKLWTSFTKENYKRENYYLYTLAKN